MYPPCSVGLSVALSPLKPAYLTVWALPWAAAALCATADERAADEAAPTINKPPAPTALCCGASAGDNPLARRTATEIALLPVFTRKVTCSFGAAAYATNIESPRFSALRFAPLLLLMQAAFVVFVLQKNCIRTRSRACKRSALLTPCLLMFIRTSSQVKLILSPKQRAKPAASRTRTCTYAAVCIASGECPSRF
jgi:hypothetical protein